MRILWTLVLLVCACVRSEAKDLPKDGNDVLDQCSVMITLADSPQSTKSLSNEEFTEMMGKGSWCSGYLQAVEDASWESQLKVAIVFGTMKLTFAAPAKNQETAFQVLRTPCLPENVTVLQIARVVVKWLRDHPERLNQQKSILVGTALSDAFTCDSALPHLEEAKPAPPKKP